LVTLAVRGEALDGCIRRIQSAVIRLSPGFPAPGAFASDDNDITYFYGSPLPSEAQPIEHRHFHPVEPRTFRLTVETRF